MKSGLDELMQSLQASTNHHIELSLNQTRKEAQQKYDEIMEDARARVEKVKERHIEALKTLQNSERNKSKKILQREIEIAQEKYIDKVIETVKERLNQTDSSQIIKLLERALSKHDPKEKPQIVCSSHYFEKVSEVYGNEYQVKEDQSLSSGFILVYENYDENYIMNNLIDFNQEHYRKLAMLSLFEEARESWII